MTGITRKILKQVEEADKLDQVSVIGVHCTHGINRTGYVIAAFLKIHYPQIQIEDAIQMFSTSRLPHPFERDNLIDDLLFKGYGE